MLNSDTFWALVALIIFVGIIIAVGGPGMIARALDGRTNRIRTELDEARKAREEARAAAEESHAFATMHH